MCLIEYYVHKKGKYQNTKESLNCDELKHLCDYTWIHVLMLRDEITQELESGEFNNNVPGNLRLNVSTSIVGSNVNIGMFDCIKICYKAASTFLIHVVTSWTNVVQ